MSFPARRRDKPIGDAPPTLWRATAVVNNGVATVTRAAETGKSHYIVFLFACYSDITKDGVASYSEGGTINFYFNTKVPFSPAIPLRALISNSVEASLPASGTAGVWGSVVMIGYTK